MVVKSTLFWFLLVTMSAKAMTFSTFKLLSPFLLPLATFWFSVSIFTEGKRAWVLSCDWLSATSWTGALQVPASTGFSRHEYWSGMLISSSRGYSPPRDLLCLLGPPGKPFYRRVRSVCFMSDLTQQLSPNHLYFPPATSSSQGYCLVGVGGAAGVDDIHTSDLADHKFAWLWRKIPLSFRIVNASSWSAAHKQTVCLTLRMHPELSLNSFFLLHWLNRMHLVLCIFSYLSLKHNFNKILENWFSKTNIHQYQHHLSSLRKYHDRESCSAIFASHCYSACHLGCHQGQGLCCWVSSTPASTSLYNLGGLLRVPIQFLARLSPQNCQADDFSYPSGATWLYPTPLSPFSGAGRNFSVPARSHKVTGFFKGTQLQALLPVCSDCCRMHLWG